MFSQKTRSLAKKTSKPRLAIATAVLSILLGISGQVIGDTIILNDGRIMEGTITREGAKYVKMDTQFGSKSFRRSDIKKIIKESQAGSALQAIETTKDFTALSEIGQVLKNAQALYDLRRFNDIPPLIEPWKGKGTQYDDMRIRWLLIEMHERKGEWDKAEELLKKTLEDGREPDKIRAQAHLDIFEENPDYTLRKIGGKRTKEFLTRDQRNRGKIKNALQDPELMQAALVETLNQLLRNEKVSTAALEKENMIVQETVEVVRAAMNSGEEENQRDRNDNDSRSRRQVKASSVIKELPYLEAMRKVEKSIYEAQAIDARFARGFGLDLVRTEAKHLEEVLRILLTDIANAYPDENSVGIDKKSGRLTSQGREQWREKCDHFLRQCKPVEELIEYMLTRIRAYPKQLKPWIEQWEQTLERIQQMQQNTVRNYDRVRA